MENSAQQEAGRAAAQAIWDHGTDASFEEHDTEAFASAAIAEFGRLQRDGTPGIYKQALDGAERGAKDLDTDRFHGIIEVIQNADDAGASKLHMELAAAGKIRKLRFVHDGRPARLKDVVAMALAFISTKREDASAKGRFGIGLKTLRALGGNLEVHSGPYRARIADGVISAVTASTKRKSVSARETTLELELDADINRATILRWLNGNVRPSTLLFLDAVREVSFPSGSRARGFRVELDESNVRTYPLKMGRITVDCTEATLSSSQGGSWLRYSVERPVPSRGPRRNDKSTGKSTPLAVAIPRDVGAEPGQLFAGLPLSVGVGWPMSINAQFDVDTSRRGLSDNEWNRWLISRAGELVRLVVQRCFALGAAAGWGAIPLSSEIERMREGWLRSALAEEVQAVHATVRRRALIEVDGDMMRLDRLVYEAVELEPLVSTEMLSRLTDDVEHPLSKADRDSEGRWRLVMKALDAGREISIEDSLDLLELENEELGDPTVGWFIRLAHLAIRNGEGVGLLRVRSIVLASGERVVPPDAENDGSVLVRKADSRALATRLDLARPVDAVYLKNGASAKAVRRWLEEEKVLSKGIAGIATLRALGQIGRTASRSPIPVSDDDLIEIRRQLAQIPEDELEDLGPSIGAAIEVDGFHFVKGKRTAIGVCPASGYLPATIEDRVDGWAKAAGPTSGIHWLANRYQTRLRRSPGDKATPGASKFFRILGAATTPRLERPKSLEHRYGSPAAPLDVDLLPDQQAHALAGTHVTHLQGDFESPDLLQVVEGISRERSKRRRGERAQALIRTIDREWSSTYEGNENATGVYSAYSWAGHTEVPASWRARVMDMRWLATESGELERPTDLVVRSPTNEVLFGRDFERYAADIAAGLANSSAVRALGIRADADASEIVSQLRELQKGEEPESAEVAVRYLTLDALVTRVDASPEELVGDLRVDELRRSFGVGTRSKGLIYVGRTWRRPTDVFRGPSIFGDRRPFVPEGARADRLWRVLGVRLPDARDCLEILHEIASAPPDAESENETVATLDRLSKVIGDASPQMRRKLGSTPLWNGSRWTKSRPLYAVDDADLTEALGKKLPMWRPPLTPSSIANLLPILGVQLIEDSNFEITVTEDDLALGEQSRPVFVGAIQRMRDDLTRNDRRLHDDLSVPWSVLTEMDLAVVSRLAVTLQLDGHRALTVQSHVHLQRKPRLMLASASEEDIGRRESGGNAIAALFAPENRFQVSLAWANAWVASEEGVLGERLALPDIDQTETEMDALLEQARQTVSADRPNSSATGGVTPRSSSHPPPRVRRLKSVDELVVSSVDRPKGKRRPPQPPAIRKLKRRLPSGNPPADATAANPSTVDLFSPQQQEVLSLAALYRAINGELSGIRDFRELRGVGADAIDKLQRFFEIKSAVTVMPNHIDLTLNEYERAVREREKFYLAVVSGLGEGHDTIVRIISDPVAVLTKDEKRAVRLSGIRDVDRPIEVRF